MLEAAPGPDRPRRERRLEVVVLAARGLAGAGRRKVQLTLVSARDPEGEAFGAKVSPWTQAASGGSGSGSGRLRFGQRGLCCSFPLETSQGAPALAADVRFADATRLRVRLLASMVPSQNAVLRAAAKILPSSITDGVSKELDEVTADVEAEVLIPLANILSGRTGFAADRALGGWVPLRPSTVGSEDGRGATRCEEEPPLSLWMQMYAVPDHEAMLPKLQAQLEDERARQDRLGGAQRQPGPGSAGDMACARPAQAPAGGSSAAGAARPAAAPRWGPAARGPAQAAGASTAPAAPDLIDVSLEDGPAATVGADLLGSGAVGSLPRLGAAGPDLLSEDVGSLQEPEARGWNLEAELLGMALPSALPQPGPAGGPAQTLAGAASLSGGGAASAFGFIAAATPGVGLDLAALYGSSCPAQGGAGCAGRTFAPLAPTSVPAEAAARFAPLACLDKAGTGQSDPLKSLEAEFFAGLR